MDEISIHALRKESDILDIIFSPNYLVISIHALRKESDHVLGPAGGLDGISIHALRKESDQ